MIDRRFIGHRLAPFTVDVEPGRLRFFAKATGHDDPVYGDEEAARAAGHPGLPVPPTFFFCLEMESPNPAIRTSRTAISAVSRWAVPSPSGTSTVALVCPLNVKVVPLEPASSRFPLTTEAATA